MSFEESHEFDKFLSPATIRAVSLLSEKADARRLDEYETAAVGGVAQTSPSDFSNGRHRRMNRIINLPSRVRLVTNEETP